MKRLVTTREISLVLLMLMLLGNLCSADQKEDDKILDFLDENKFLQGKSEIVFLLDRSGSVGATNFEIQKGFIESLLTQVIVDVNATRVAVISYSQEVVRHIDYLTEPKNKCFLSQELVDVTFENSGATNIAAALKEALKVFENARPNVNKVVILISDGLATAGGDPKPHADRLKQTGAQIFAFGIGRFLKTELRSLTSSERHVYSCSEFREFKQLAKKIRGDPHERSWSGHALQPKCDHLCHSPYKGEANDPGCCDHYARCSCALLSGMHTCVCGPGYYGLSGLAGHCRACPKGSYKSKMEPTEQCETCPPFSTTTKEASTSLKDCFCKEGYQGNVSAGIPCTAVKCPPLQKPTNGHIAGDCRNTYGSTCHFICEDGYELADEFNDVRTCRSDGTWSASTTVCRRIICNAIQTPIYGRKYCGKGDLTVGKVCNFRCLEGFVMDGSTSRECLPSKHWSGKEVKCLPKECPVPPAMKHADFISCATDKKGSYMETCAYSCKHGFQLIGPRFLLCNDKGVWVNAVSGNEERPFCKDTEPPRIKCPGLITVSTLRGKDYVNVEWKEPHATDNSGYPPVLRTNPIGVKSPSPFLVGINKFEYIATDWIGLTSSCQVLVNVVDKEPPRIVSCPSKIEASSTDGMAIVNWDQPTFDDNDRSGELTIKNNSKSGDKFTVGHHRVYYIATDSSGNKATCKFDVIVSRTYCPYHPPPANGAFTCDDWMYGQFCQAFCNDRFDFVKEAAEWYVCNADAVWVTMPEGYPIPWPDCARPMIPNTIKKMMSGFYYSGDCNDPRVQKAIKKMFLSHFIGSFQKKGLCNFEGGCKIDKVKVRCGAVDHTLTFKRRRRDVWEQTERESLEVEFEITINSDHELNATDSLVQEFMDTIKNLQWNDEESWRLDLATQSSLENEIEDDLQSKSGNFVFTNEETVFVCHPGSVLNDELCVSCPPGTFYSNSTKDCQDCSIGFYQEKEGKTECEICPVETSTENLRTRNRTECKRICSPGTYSATGLETCLACPLGTYQDDHGKKSCHTCPNGSTTSVVQSTSANDCKGACDPGSFSENGLHPCNLCPKSYYQPHGGQKKCLECPVPLSTQVKGSRNITQCAYFDPCMDIDAACENGGVCVRSGRQPSCQCRKGFNGNRCEFDIDECLGEPCLNNGSCVNLVGSYYCNCSSGFNGMNCEDEIDECLSSPCLNNGTCIDKVDSYLCVCVGGYEGQDCETYVETCFNDVICLNGGWCEYGANETDSHCNCSLGYAGSDCSININDCENVTCMNNGRCVDGVASFSCACPAGYTGHQCEVEINECQDNLCWSGATCKDLIGRYQCVCPPGWSGILCENKLSSDFMLMFPEDQASIANMASTTIASPLSQATVSMWVQTTDTERSGTPLSYAVAAISSSDAATTKGVTVDNALTISDCSGVQVYVNNEPVVTDLQIADGKWHHLAFTWSSDDSGSWNLYKDGHLQSEGKGLRPDDTIMEGGTLILGQEQDTVGGGFSPLETFTGNITRVNIWNSYFSSSNVSRLCNKDDDIPGKIVAWPDFLSEIKGDVKVIKTDIITNEL